MLGVQVTGHQLPALVAELVADAVTELDVTGEVLVSDLNSAHGASLPRHQTVATWDKSVRNNKCGISREFIAK